MSPPETSHGPGFATVTSDGLPGCRPGAPGRTLRSRMDEVARIYEAHAVGYDRARDRSGTEMPYLRRVLDEMPAGPATVLDLGCGAGEPVARFFVEAGCAVTGVDVAPAMLAIARARFPGGTWLTHDMRSLALGRRFAAVVGWDSVFHLRRDEQRAMFAVFRDHLAPGGVLLFTSGHLDGETTGTVDGERVYHASLAPAAYAALLAAHDLELLLHRVRDPDCGEHTVWMARRMA